MAKVKGPILSISASGQLGKAMVFGSWRGVAYARQHVTPANPQSTEQTTTRNTFSGLDDHYKKMGTLGRAPWDLVAKGRPLTGRNALIRDNLSALRGEADMANFTASPGALGGLPPTNLTASAGTGSGEIDVDVSNPQEPVDWVLESVIVTAFQDRDPATVMPDFQVEQENTSPTPDGTDTITLTGLDASTDYLVSAWLKWTRADGVTAYGSSLAVIATSAA